jgi:hypothetical protein
MSLLHGRKRRSRREFAFACLESLERRALLAAVAVDAGEVARAIDPQSLGVNATWWDTNLSTGQTAQAAIVRHSGAVYVIRDASYDGVINPGRSVSFQLRGTGRKLRSGPVKYWLDSVPISGSTIL